MLNDEGQGTRIQGGGGLGVVELYRTWAHSYKYSRDTVDISYTHITSFTALQDYKAGLIDFTGTDGALDPETALGLIQLPLVGSLSLLPTIPFCMSSL